MTLEQTKEWVNFVLCNDESSTDEELVHYFVENGLAENVAKAVVGRRAEFKDKIVVPEPSLTQT